MLNDRTALDRGLDRLQDVLPCRYAQWLVEQPQTWDYRVVALNAPAGEAGFETAHRTGVIGQVFRTGRALFVADTRHHPLYDPFDPAVEWELAVPVWDDHRLAAVLNCEGAGKLLLTDDLWRSLTNVIRSATSWRSPGTPPGAETGLLTTTHLMGQSARDGAAISAITTVARVLADAGQSVLLLGDFPGLTRGPYPSVMEAEARGLALAECIYGIGPRLDLLPAVPQEPGMAAFERSGGWRLLEGRYNTIIHQVFIGDKSPAAGGG